MLTPQPEVQIRGDGGAQYESVGRIIYAVPAGRASRRSASSPSRRFAARLSVAEQFYRGTRHGNERRLGQAARAIRK